MIKKQRWCTPRTPFPHPCASSRFIPFVPHSLHWPTSSNAKQEYSFIRFRYSLAHSVIHLVSWKKRWRQTLFVAANWSLLVGTTHNPKCPILPLFGSLIDMNDLPLRMGWISVRRRGVGLSDYSIQIKTQYSCNKPVWIPNVFTPNGTALNETFGPHCISCKTIYIQIYNRWGECVYKGSEPWDGTYRGEPVPNGTYAYKMGVELTFGSTLQNSFFYGDVQLLRWTTK